MRRHIAIMSLALATATIGASQAVAQQSGTPVYTYFYYDAYGNHVGTMRGRCYYDGSVRYTLTGSQSPYREEVLNYYCGENGPEPIE